MAGPCGSCLGAALSRVRASETADHELREELGVSGSRSPTRLGPATTTTPGMVGPSTKRNGFWWREHRGRSRPSPSGRRGPRGDYFVGARWLTVREMRESIDLIAPCRLAELLLPLLAGDIPPTPIETGV